MARRRGPSNMERLAFDMANVTATGAVVAAPCFVYACDFTLTDGTTTGKFSIGDTTAAADLVKESTRLDFKIGTAGSSGNSDCHDLLQFNPPVYIANQLFFANATGVNSVSVAYLAAS